MKYIHVWKVKLVHSGHISAINTILSKTLRSHSSVAVCILDDRTGLTIARVERLLV